MRLLKHLLISVCLLLICSAYARADQIDWEIASIERVANPPESVALEYRFSDNEVRRYDVKLAGEGTMKLPGQNREVKLQANGDMIFTEQVLPKETAGDTWRVRHKLVKGRMTIPDFGEMAVTAPLFEVEMDKYGAVRQIKGLDQLASTSGLPPDQGLTEIVSQLKFVGFPKKPLKLNDSWEDNYSITPAGQQPIAVKATSTLASFDRIQKTDCATIVTKYEVPFSVPVGAVDEKVADAKPSDARGKTLTGAEKGEFRTYFSYSDGKIMQSFGTIELTADLDSGAKPAEAGSASETPKHDLNVKYYVTSVYNPVPIKEAAQPVKGRTP